MWEVSWNGSKRTRSEGRAAIVNERDAGPASEATTDLAAT
jgi:hypothetical protein